MAFLGTFDLLLDDKGRLFLPAKWRNSLAEDVVILKGQERCLYVVTMSAFEAMTREARGAPIGDKPARDFTRIVFSSASDQTPDKQGRISVPPLLRTYANLSRECTLTGAGDRIEVWDSAAWTRLVEQIEPGYADLDAGRSALAAP